jgi:hypothetical protein
MPHEGRHSARPHVRADLQRRDRLGQLQRSPFRPQEGFDSMEKGSTSLPSKRRVVNFKVHIGPATGTGVERSVVVPSPSWP